MGKEVSAEVIVVGGGLAGLSAAIYLGRARRETLVVDEGRSMARWEPEVQNYLGFPEGIGGEALVERGRKQARRYGARFCWDRIQAARRDGESFVLEGHEGKYQSRRLLLATGIYHIPPDLPGVEPCLGHSMFFCKDCDGYRVYGKTVGIYGWSNEAIEYALAMVLYSPCVLVLTDGRTPRWDHQHAAWAKEHEIPIYTSRIRKVRQRGGKLKALGFEEGSELMLQALFTTRGDLYLNELARGLGARVDKDGEVVVDLDMRSTVDGLYAAGCVTPANCQMIIAAGQGATAAQAINRDLFEESLATHSLQHYRGKQLRVGRTRPVVRSKRALRAG